VIDVSGGADGDVDLLQGRVSVGQRFREFPNRATAHPAISPLPIARRASPIAPPAIADFKAGISAGDSAGMWCSVEGSSYQRFWVFCLLQGFFVFFTPLCDREKRTEKVGCGAERQRLATERRGFWDAGNSPFSLRRKLGQSPR
jgi:hypothetical protein